MLKNGIFCEMIILAVFKGFLLVKNLEIWIQIVLDRPIYYYYYYTMKRVFVIIFELIDITVFLKISFSSSDFYFY